MLQKDDEINVRKDYYIVYCDLCHPFIMSRYTSSTSDNREIERIVTKSRERKTEFLQRRSHEIAVRRGGFRDSMS